MRKMKVGFLKKTTRVTVVIMICLCGLSCGRKSKYKQFEDFFPQIDLPKISIDDAVEQSKIEMRGEFVDKDDEMESGWMDIRFFPDQMDSERGLPVVIKIQPDLFLSKYARGIDKADIKCAYLVGGFYKDGKLNAYKAEAYPRDSIGRINDEDMTILNLNEKWNIGFKENSLLMLDWMVEDFGHLYGELKYPVFGQQDSIINLSLSVYEANEILPKYNEASVVTEYYRKSDSGTFNLTLLPFQVSKDDCRVMVFGSYIDKYVLSSGYTIAGFLNENNEFNTRYNTVKWTPKELYIRVSDDEDIKYVLHNQSLSRDQPAYKGMIEAQLEELDLSYIYSSDCIPYDF